MSPMPSDRVPPINQGRRNSTSTTEKRLSLPRKAKPKGGGRTVTAYLRDVFERLPLIDPSDETALEQLRPSVWAAAFKARREHTSPGALKSAPASRARRSRRGTVGRLQPLCSKRAMSAPFSSSDRLVRCIHRTSPPRAAAKVETEGVRSDGYGAFLKATARLDQVIAATPTGK